MGVSTLLGRAMKLADAGRFEEARTLLDRAAVHPRAGAGVYIQRAMVLSRLELYADAAESTGKAFELAPRNPASSVFHGMFLLDAGKITEARAVLAGALTLDPGNRLAEGLLAVADLMEGKTTEAAARLGGEGPAVHLELILRLSPLVERAALEKVHGKAPAEAAAAKVRSAFGKKRKIADFSVNPPMTTAEMSLRSGWKFFFNGDFESAAPRLGVAAALSGALHGLALFYADKREEAKGPLKRAVDDLDAGRAPLTEETHEALECLGELVFDECELVDALDVFERAGSLKESSAGRRSDYFLGVLADFSGRRTAASGHFRALISSEPNLIAERLKYALKKL
jgi:tetratricopeptide (TPR) repeat protein